MHIMLDLETWGKRPGCDIRSIGACVFDPSTGKTPDDALNCEPEAVFYIACNNPTKHNGYWRDGTWHDPQSKYPLHRDPETVQWWSEQSAEAQGAFADACDTREALRRFTMWLSDIIGSPDLTSKPQECTTLRIWAHGPQFDISILAAAYEAVGLPVPWHYRAPRDTRTIMEAAGIDPHKGLELFVQPDDVYHHALSDSIVQARAVCAAYKVLRGPHETQLRVGVQRQSSPELSSLAGRVLNLGATGTPEYNDLLMIAKRLAGSVLSQDE